MNTWPTAIDYRDALQHPERAFRDPALQLCRAETNKMGVPRARSGAFANVYKLENGGSARAVRVFLYPQPEREERYQAVSDHLRQRGRPGGLIDFRYEAYGIRVGADWFPILIMDWVKGESLGEWAGAAVQRQERPRLVQLAEQWVKLVGALRAAHIAHGDLQHDNILIVNDVPFLVDYDCMCVPALVGRRALEAGKPAYQHPRRVEQELSLDLDHFSAWIILTALRALAADLTLWAKYVERSGNENLLFTEDDLKKPTASPLWADLLASPDSEVRGWARALRDTLPDRPLTQVPPFGLVPQRAPREACQTHPPAAQAAGRPLPADLVKILDELETARRNPGNGRALVSLWARHGSRLAGVAEALPLRAEAELWRSRIEACDRFKTVSRQPDTPERTVAAAWDRLDQVGGHPDAAADRPRADLAHRRADLLDNLNQAAAAQTEDGDRQFLAAWDDRLLTGCPEGDALRPKLRGTQARLQALQELEAVAAQADRGQADEARVAACASRLPPQYKHRLASRVAQAQQRVQARDEFGRLAAQPGASERAVTGARSRLEAPGGHHCRVEDARARDEILGHLWGQAIEEGEDADRHVVGLWDEDLLGGCEDAEPLRPSFEAARARLQMVEELRQAVERAEQGQGREQDIVRAAAGLPDGYAYSLSGRVQRARHQVGVSEELDRLIHADPLSDVVLADAFERALAGGSLRLPKTVVARCRLAVQRRNCLRRLHAIDTSLSLDRQDTLWVQSWDDALLEGCLDARRSRPRYLQAVARSSAWKELEDVLRRRDLGRIRTAAANPLLADYPPRAAHAQEIEELLRQAKQMERVRELLRLRRASGFTDADLQFIRDNEALFRPCQRELEDVLGEWLTGPLGLRPSSPAYASDAHSGVVTAKWVWPHECVRYCHVAVDPDRFFETPEEAEDGMTRVFAESYRRAGGLPLPIMPRWRRTCVTVWPVIDLGWLKLRGQPLKLGPVPLSGLRR